MFTWHFANYALRDEIYPTPDSRLIKKSTSNNALLRSPSQPISRLSPLSASAFQLSHPRQHILLLILLRTLRFRSFTTTTLGRTHLRQHASHGRAKTEAWLQSWPYPARFGLTFAPFVLGRVGDTRSLADHSETRRGVNPAHNTGSFLETLRQRPGTGQTAKCNDEPTRRTATVCAGQTTNYSGEIRGRTDGQAAIQFERACH